MYPLPCPRWPGVLAFAIGSRVNDLGFSSIESVELAPPHSNRDRGARDPGRGIWLLSGKSHCQYNATTLSISWISGETGGIRWKVAVGQKPLSLPSFRPTALVLRDRRETCLIKCKLRCCVLSTGISEINWSLDAVSAIMGVSEQPSPQGCRTICVRVWSWR